MGGSPFPVFTLSSALTSSQLNSGPLNAGIANGTISWTTADGVPLFGGPIDLVVFNPGGIVTVTGDLGFESGVEALFTGSFQNYFEHWVKKRCVSRVLHKSTFRDI